jgi:hypothetical protein
MLSGHDTLKGASSTFAKAIVTAGLLILASFGAANADYESTQGEFNTLRNPLIPGAPFAEPLQPAMPGQPPPPGAGPTPMPVIPGDQGNPVPPPEGTVDTTNGSIDTVRNAPGPKAPTIYLPNAGRYQTIRGQDQGVYDYGQEDPGNKTINNGGARNNATGVTNNGGPRAGAADTADTIFAHNNEQSRYQPIWVLPTVPNLCRYLVILGVVAATVWIIQASMAMVMGNQYAGGRIIGAAGGLLLLLSGYTIWKIVQMDAMHANSIGWTSQYRNGQGQPLAQKNGMAFPNGTNNNQNPYNDNGP